MRTGDKQIGRGFGELFLASSIISLADDSDGELVILALVCCGECLLGPFASVLCHRRNIPRTEGFVEGVVLSYQLDDFKRHFRVRRGTAEVLVRSLSTCEEMHRAHESGGRRLFPVEKQLLICLRMLAATETNSSVADRFGVCEFTVYRTTRRVIYAIYKHFTPSIICWPTVNPTISPITLGFQRSRGLN